MELIKEYITLITDIGIIIGLPIILYYVILLNKKRVENLKSQIDLLKETQFYRALNQIKSQKELYKLEKDELEQRISEMDSNLIEKEKHLEKITKSLDFTKNRLLHYESIEEDMLKIKSNKFTHITNDKELIFRFLDAFSNSRASTITDTNSWELTDEQRRRWKMFKKLEELGFAICSEAIDYDHDEVDYTYTLTDSGLELKQILENKINTMPNILYK